MKTNDNNKAFQEIENLIKLEQKAAFKIFNQKDFSSQLDKRIMAEPRKTILFPVVLKKPVYSFMFLIILISVLLVSLIYIIPTFSTKKNITKIEKLFLNIPVLQQQISTLKHQVDLTDDQILRSELEWMIKGAFYSIQKRVYSKEDLTGIFKRVLEIGETEKETKDKTKIIFERGAG